MTPVSRDRLNSGNYRMSMGGDGIASPHHEMAIIKNPKLFEAFRRLSPEQQMPVIEAIQSIAKEAMGDRKKQIELAQALNLTMGKLAAELQLDPNLTIEDIIERIKESLKGA